MQRSRTSRTTAVPGAAPGVLAALSVLAALGLSACGGTGAVSSPAPHPTVTAASSGASAGGGGASPTATGGSSDGVSPGTGSAAAGGTAGTATAAPTTPPPSSGSGSGCLTGTVAVSYPGGHPGGGVTRALCVHAGTHLRITLRAEPGAPWRPVVTSAPQTLALVADTVSAGSVDATARAVAAGTAVLSAETRQPGGPGGPMMKHWELEVTVVP